MSGVCEPKCHGYGIGCPCRELSRMTAEREGADVEAVLAAHEYMPCAEHTPTIHAWWAQCEGCDWRGPRRSQRHSDEDDHRTHVAEILAPLIAERERLAAERALREFVGWVAINRAYNGSNHDHGQSLYNECLNGVLPTWADEWLRGDQ